MPASRVILRTCLKDALLNGQQGNIESAAAQVKDEHILLAASGALQSGSNEQAAGARESQANKHEGNQREREQVGSN